MRALEEMKARIEVLAYEGPLEVRVTENLRWADVFPKAETTHPERLARCADDDYAELFAHAPEDLAKLIAALEAVDAALVKQVEHFREFFGKDRESMQHIANSNRAFGADCALGAARKAIAEALA